MQTALLFKRGYLRVPVAYLEPFLVPFLTKGWASWGSSAHAGVVGCNINLYVIWHGIF